MLGHLLPSRADVRAPKLFSLSSVTSKVIQSIKVRKENRENRVEVETTPELVQR